MLTISALALSLSTVSIIWHMYEWYKKRTVKLEVRQLHTQTGKEDRKEITLLFRNLSHRSTAITNISLLDNTESPFAIKAPTLSYRGISDRMPLRIAPWDAVPISFPVSSSTKRQMKGISIRDMEDQRTIIDQPPQHTEWHRLRPSNKWWEKLRKYFGKSSDIV